MIEHGELRLIIRNMTPRQEIYKLLKDELSKQGHWRNLPRGNPFEAYKAQQYGKEHTK